MKLTRHCLGNINKMLDFYSQFNPSPLSIKQFIDFGEFSLLALDASHAFLLVTSHARCLRSPDVRRRSLFLFPGRLDLSTEKHRIPWRAYVPFVSRGSFSLFLSLSRLLRRLSAIDREERRPNFERNFVIHVSKLI